MSTPIWRHWPRWRHACRSTSRYGYGTRLSGPAWIRGPHALQFSAVNALGAIERVDGANGIGNPCPMTVGYNVRNRTAYISFERREKHNAFRDEDVQALTAAVR